MSCRQVHQPPPPHLLGLMMNSWFRTCFHCSFPENLAAPSRQIVFHLSFSGILSLSYPDTNQIWISDRYDGWNIFPRVITMVFMWPGKVLSCLAHLAGGPIIIDSFSARLSIFPLGNCKTYSISCFRWILRIQSLTFAWRTCQRYLEACLWYSDSQ